MNHPPTPPSPAALITLLKNYSQSSGTAPIQITGTENVNGTLVFIESNGSTLTLT